MARSDGHFKKGNKLGKGQPKTPEEILAAAKLSRKSFQGLFHKFSLMDITEFRSFVEADKMNVMEKIISSIMIKAIEGEGKAAALIWDRMMGRVKEEIEISMPKPVLIERPSGEQILLGVDQNSIDGEILE